MALCSCFAKSVWFIFVNLNSDFKLRPPVIRKLFVYLVLKYQWTSINMNLLTFVLRYRNSLLIYKYLNESVQSLGVLIWINYSILISRKLCPTIYGLYRQTFEMLNKNIGNLKKKFLTKINLYILPFKKKKFEIDIFWKLCLNGIFFDECILSVFC